MGLLDASCTDSQALSSRPLAAMVEVSPSMALVLADTDVSAPPADEDLVEGDILLLFGCFDRLSDAVGSPMVLFRFQQQMTWLI